MDLQKVINHCLALPGAEETTPFGPEVLVYKVAGKMFAALAFRNDEPGLNLKCDPERALELRDRHEGITPGYHMSKVHWNSVYMNAGLHPDLVLELIDHSYELIVASLTKKLQKELAEL